MQRIRVTVTLDPGLLTDRDRLQAAAGRVASECDLAAVDDTLLDYGVLMADADVDGIGKLRGLAEVAAVDLDEKRFASQESAR